MVQERRILKLRCITELPGEFLRLSVIFLAKQRIIWKQFQLQRNIHDNGADYALTSEVDSRLALIVQDNMVV